MLLESVVNVIALQEACLEHKQGLESYRRHGVVVSAVTEGTWEGEHKFDLVREWTAYVSCEKSRCCRHRLGLSCLKLVQGF